MNQRATFASISNSFIMGRWSFKKWYASRCLIFSFLQMRDNDAFWSPRVARCPKVCKGLCNSQMHSTGLSATNYKPKKFFPLLRDVLVQCLEQPRCMSRAPTHHWKCMWRWLMLPHNWLLIHGNTCCNIHIDSHYLSSYLRTICTCWVWLIILTLSRNFFLASLIFNAILFKATPMQISAVVYVDPIKCSQVIMKGKELVALKQ